MWFAPFILVLLIIWIVVTVKSGNKFRDAQQQLSEGMTQEEVIKLMGDPDNVKHHPTGHKEYIYEKSEWKGIFRGGTANRRVEVVFDENNKVYSIIRNKDARRSGW